MCCQPTLYLCLIPKQCGKSSSTESDDRRQPRCGLWADSAPSSGGDSGSHHGHQIPKYCSGDPHRAPRQGKKV